MSKPIDPFTDSLNIQTINTIDRMDLPIMQKHHLRILAHCLIILKTNTSENSSLYDENLLRKWCNNQSQKFNDQNFQDLLYEQLVSTAKKLNNFSQRCGKTLNELEIDDLALLVQENSENQK